MGRNVVIASVQHSGTHFVKHLFSDWQERPVPSLGDGAFFQEHVWPESLLAIRQGMRDGIPCIVPLRHPVSIALSWKVRAKNIAHLMTEFRALVSAVDPLGPLYLPLDVPDREDYLGAISAAVGVKLATDWQKRNASKKQGRLEEGADTLLITDIQRELGHFFSRFGYAARQG